MSTLTPTAATTRDLEIHLAYEVDWLVYAATRFSQTKGKDAVVIQDGVFLHVRNLLEFTKPYQTRYGWGIAQFGGATPYDSPEFDAWNGFINANVAHLGESRLDAITWPAHAHGADRHVVLATYCLERIKAHAPGTSAPSGEVVLRVVGLGLLYLKTFDAMALEQLDALTVR